MSQNYPENPSGGGQDPDATAPSDPLTPDEAGSVTEQENDDDVDQP
jgi:hypothetical protein